METMMIVLILSSMLNAAALLLLYFRLSRALENLKGTSCTVEAGNEVHITSQGLLIKEQNVNSRRRRCEPFRKNGYLGF